MSLGIAAALALVSGLSAFYMKDPSFGAAKDYLLMFLWGTGIDQTKNGLQILQNYSSTANKP
jgi:hypothetical protein